MPHLFTYPVSVVCIYKPFWFAASFVLLPISVRVEHFLSAFDRHYFKSGERLMWKPWGEHPRLGRRAFAVFL